MQREKIICWTVQREKNNLMNYAEKKKLLNYSVDGKIMTKSASESLDWHPYRSNGYLHDL